MPDSEYVLQKLSKIKWGGRTREKSPDKEVIEGWRSCFVTEVTFPPFSTTIAKLPLSVWRKEEDGHQTVNGGFLNKPQTIYTLVYLMSEGRGGGVLDSRPRTNQTHSKRLMIFKQGQKQFPWLIEPVKTLSLFLRGENWQFGCLSVSPDGQPNFFFWPHFLVTIPFHIYAFFTTDFHPKLILKLTSQLQNILISVISLA